MIHKIDSRHSKSLLRKIAETLQDDTSDTDTPANGASESAKSQNGDSKADSPPGGGVSSKRTLFTFVKVAKFFFRENLQTAAGDLCAVVLAKWSAISRISEASKENLLLTVHLLKHLFLLDKAECLRVTLKSKLVANAFT
jgi:hypothetical protein